MMSMTREQAFAEGVVAIPRLLLSLLRTADVSPKSLLAMIDAQPGDKSITGAGWRTSTRARSWSRSACQQGALIKGLPEDMPHVSGFRSSISLLSSYIQYDDDVRFYGSDQDPDHVLLKSVHLPHTAMQAATGRHLHEVIAHPSIRADHPVTVTRVRRVADGTAINIDKASNRVVYHPIHGEIAIREDIR